MKSVTVRLNDGEYSLLRARAVTLDVSVTRLSTAILQEAIRTPNGHPEPEPDSCVRESRHEPGVRCLLCGFS